ncbi:MAG: protein RhiA [Clostridiales bacterium]|nr:protein RhiA [Clostridiales bacterium]
MSTKYKLNVVNNSLVSGTICLYQTMPDQDDDIFSLAWFTKNANPETRVTFTWSLEFCASWSQTGTLKPGVFYDASQEKVVDPSDPNNNSYLLTMYNGAYQFVKADQTAQKGCIGIFCDDTIPNLKASIGIGMGGKPAFATQALMNTDFTFIPKVKYWLGFGKYEQGQVMDLSRMNHIQEIAFEPNCYELTAILGRDNKWEIE